MSTTTMETFAGAVAQASAAARNEDRQARLGPAIGITLGLVISFPIWAIVGWTVTKVI